MELFVNHLRKMLRFFVTIFNSCMGVATKFDASVLHSLPQHETYIGHDQIPNDDEILKAS